MKKVLGVAVCLIFVIYFIFLNNSYSLKIELDIKNKNVVEIDNTIAKKIEQVILNIPKIQDVVIFSSIHGCNIYCKFLPFVNRDNLFLKIKQELEPVISGFSEIKNVYFNNKYNLKYNYFLILKSSGDYYFLKKQVDEILDIILQSRFLKDTKVYGLTQKTDYIYFSSDNLLKYDLDLGDIQKIIEQNNNCNDFIMNQDSDKFALNLNSCFKNIDDVKNTLLPFRNSNFSIKFQDVFMIKKGVKYPPVAKIFYKDKEAVVFAISSFNPFLIFNLKNKLKKYDIEVIKPNKMKKIEFYLNPEANISDTLKEYKNLYKRFDKNNIYFIAQNPPRVNTVENFDEIKQNRIVIFSNHSDYVKILSKIEDVTITPQKTKTIQYKFNDFNMNKYGISKKEVLNVVLANSQGFVCGHYFDSLDKIEIVLKNKNQSDNFVYSKKYKAFIPLNELVVQDFKMDFIEIARKNGKHFTIKLKNGIKKPSYY